MKKKLGSSNSALYSSYYEIAELKFKEKDLVESENYLTKGSKLKGDGNEILTARYNIATQQFKKIKEKAKKENKQ